MSSLRPVGRSAAARKNDRKSLCRFTFADGRQCRTNRLRLRILPCLRRGPSLSSM